MKLSILIPTLPERSQYLRRIKNILDPQIARFPGDVEIKLHEAGRGTMTTGFKRNMLMQSSNGEYFVFVDDDDRVPMYYVDRLMNAITQNPDVITFRGYMTTNGNHRVNFTIQLGEKYEERKGHYYRFPNHICCFKKSLVEHIQFPNISQGEDFAWAKKINDLGILKTEVHIPEEMYVYEFLTNKH